MLDLCAEKNNRLSQMRYKEASEGPFVLEHESLGQPGLDGVGAAPGFPDLLLR